MSNLRETDEGKKKNRETSAKIRSTDDGKENNRKRSADVRNAKKSEREKAFAEVQGKSMVNPSILDTKAYRIIKDDWLSKINIGPEYCCDICLVWCYRENVLKLNTTKYDLSILDKCYKANHGYIRKSLSRDPEWFERCYNGKQEWICKSCDEHMRKNKMPPKAQANSLELDPIIDEFLDKDGNELYPVELTLISQIIPFMFITAKHTSGIHYGLKGQCVLVPADL